MILVILDILTDCCCVSCHDMQKTQPKSSHGFSEFSHSLTQGFCMSEPAPPAPGASSVCECKYRFLVCPASPWCPGARERLGMLIRTVTAAYFPPRTESEELPTCALQAAVLGQALAVLLLWNFQDASCGLPLPQGASAGRTCHDCCVFVLCFLSI